MGRLGKRETGELSAEAKQPEQPKPDAPKE